MKIPDYLIQKIRDGQVVLFLGAGASIGAVSEPENNIPDAKKLIELISDHFLGGEDKDKSLPVIAEYAISECGDLITFQTFVRNIFLKFKAAEFHKKISSFRWSAIVTTNYDLIVENAYENDNIQILKPVIKTTDRIEEMARDNDALLYLKLHGCISKYDDPTVPLILTIDQYEEHRKNRERLFERFRSFASDFTVIFVGYRLEDPDFRKIQQEITEQGISRPRSYVVSPKPNPRDVRIWQERKIDTIDATFKEFLDELDSQIPKALRKITTGEKTHPIERTFISHQHVSPSTLAYLNNEVVYVSSTIVTDAVDPSAFYKGYSSEWSSIEAALDAPRLLTDQLLSDYIISDEADSTNSTEFYVIKGYAGSGKSVLLKRLAWESAINFGRVCLFLKADGHLRFESLREICELSDERVFIFIDRPSIRVLEIENIINTGRKRKLKITIICTERTNEWNIECSRLVSLIDQSYELRGLANKEIHGFIDKLSSKNCLGALKGLTRDEQVRLFSEYANKQLLVALYEVTSGKTFEEIIFSEYKNIYPIEAQKMYLIICSLNRLQVPVRAGIVKRLTGITFNDFKERFFGPLESIVFTEEYKPALDMAYKTRHPWIAETVFERALPDQNERYDLYLQIIGVLDIGYQPDRVAYREIVRARNLMKDFSDYTKISHIYKLAQERFIDDPYILQQEGIFEMKRANGSLEKSYSLLMKAKKIAPYDTSILHSLSELELRRANRTSTQLERDKHLKAASGIAKSLISENGHSSHAHVTIAKVGIEKLEQLINEDKVDDITFAILIKEIEKSIQEGYQKYPSDEYLTSVEAKFLVLIGHQDKAVIALEKANKANTASPYIARSLAAVYEVDGKIDLAKTILTKCLEANLSEKTINSALGLLLIKYFPEENVQAEIHLRRSFTEGDSNYYNQFWYARQLFINKKYPEANHFFKVLKQVRVNPDIKLEVRGLLIDELKKPIVFSGEIITLESSYAIIKMKGESFNTYCNRNALTEFLWEKFSINSQLKFSLGFNYYGLSVYEVLV